MMVCGSVVSSDALAGAASVSNRVPVTTIVSSGSPLAFTSSPARAALIVPIVPTVNASKAVQARSEDLF